MMMLLSPSRDAKSAGELDGWNLTFDDKLLRYTARVLGQEKIIQKGCEVRKERDAMIQSSTLPFSQVNYKAHEADWSRDMRGKILITPVPLNDFFIISTNRDSDKARDFLMTLQKVGPAMGIQVNARAQTLMTRDDRTDTFLTMIRSNLKETTQMVWLTVCGSPLIGYCTWSLVPFHCRLLWSFPPTVKIVMMPSRRCVASLIQVRYNYNLAALMVRPS